MRTASAQLALLLLSGFVLLPLPRGFSSSAPRSGRAVVESRSALPQVKEKYALLVGINEYPFLPADKQLTSCVNDVKMMRETLVRKFDFKDDDEHILELTDKAATREAILKGFERLIAKLSTNKNAVVVFHFSGHGSTVEDKNGDEARDNNDPKDKLDETLVPYDSRAPGGQVFDIIDDDVNKMFIELKKQTPYVTFIFDQCNSGTANRDLLPGSDSAEIREVPPDNKRPQPEQMSLEKLPAPGSSAGDKPDSLISAREGYVAISASRADEVSRPLSHGGMMSGALTFYLTRALHRSRPDTSYRELMEKVSVSVNIELPNQHPQADGDIDLPIFGGTANESQPLIEVEAAAGKVKVVTIKAGAAGYGVKEGTVVALYGADGRPLNGASNSPLTARIAMGGVTVDRSVAELSEEAVIARGTKADFISPAFSNINLRVAFKSLGAIAPGANPFADIAKKIDEKPVKLKFVERASADATADVFVMLGKFGEAFKDKDGKPFTDRADKRYFAPEERGQEKPLPGLDENVFYLTVRGDGRPLFGYFARPDEPRAAGRIFDVLELYARHRSLKSLVNEASPLRGKVNIRVLRVDAVEDRSSGGRRIDKPPVMLPQQNEYNVNQEERYHFLVENRSNVDLYITMVDISNDGRIVVSSCQPKVLRRAPTGEVLEAEFVPKGGTLRIPRYKDCRDTNVITARPVGTETFKVIATTSYADFSFLAQPGARLRFIEGISPLADLLARSMGNSDRDLGARSISLTDWVTAQIDFKISDVVVPR